MLDSPPPRLSGLVRKMAWRLARPGPTRRQELPDCEQDLWACLLEAWPAFDAGRSSAASFAKIVLVRACRSIRRARRARKRCSGPIIRFEEAIGVPADGDADLDRAGTERRLDFDSARRHLPSDLRALADLLETHTIAEAARALGVPRSSLQRTLGRIRHHFEAAGLGACRSTATGEGVAHVAS